MARAFAPHLITDDSVLGGKEIERSLRFDNGDGAHLIRDHAVAGNKKQWTFSCWIKRSNLGGDTFDAGEMRIFGGDTNASHIYISSGELLVWDMSDGSGTDASLVTNRMFRDHVNWFHLVCALDTDQGTASNRMRIYINGVEETAFDTSNYPSQNWAINRMNNDGLHSIGRRTSAQGSDGMKFDGYMAEIQWVDGQQLDASYFGYTDTLTGTWRPKKYEGTYGTNGFHLDFSDTTSTTTLGYDKSGNNNHWTLVNFVKQDAVPDSPTNNFATWRIQGPPFHSTATKFQRGNLEIETGTSGGGGSLARVPISSYVVNAGKWYNETWNIATYSMATVSPIQTMVARANDNTRKIMIFSSDGKLYDYRNSSSDSSPSTYAASWTNGDVIGTLIDMDASPPVVYFSKNGQWANGSGAWNQSDPYTSGGGLDMTGDMLTHSDNNQAFLGYVGFSWSSAGGGTNAKWMTNFGQDGSFANRTGAVGQYQDSAGIGNFRYSVPSGALALCSKNLARINKKTASKIINPKKHFDVLTYTGNGATDHDITGLQFKPDMVWLKGRNQSAHPGIVDSVRLDSGSHPMIYPSQEAVQTVASSYFDVGSGATPFLPNGFRVNNNTSGNNNGSTYVAWCWKAGGAAVTNNDGTIATSISANQEAGFSIVTWSGNGSAGATLGHGLGKKPKMIIVKRTVGGTQDWFMDVGEIENQRSGRYWRLRGAISPQTDTNVFPNTAPTSTVFSVGADAGVNASGSSYVAYVWTDIPGYSSFGTYKGNGNTNGRYIHTGFKPRYVMTKRSAVDGWSQWDSQRSDGHNLIHFRNGAGYADSETTTISSGTSTCDFYGDGFKWRGQSNDTNGDGDNYVYMCFAEESSNTPYFSIPTAR